MKIKDLLMDREVKNNNKIMNNLPPDVDEYAIGIEELPLDKYAVGIDFSKKQEPEEGTISEDGEIIN